MVSPNFIESYSGAASKEFCQRVIDTLNADISGVTSTEVPIHYMDGAETNGGVQCRKDRSVAFDRAHPEISAEMHQILGQYVEQYGQTYPSLGMKPCYSKNMKVQRTDPKGGFHTWHCEHALGDSAYRVLTWTLYLNDIPEGEGETEFLEYGVKVQPKAGMLCLFPAAWSHVHRGNPVYTTEKYIATGWYYLTE
jgi:hypothetical protein